METNENEDTTIQNLCDIAKAVLRGKHISIHASLKKLEKNSNTWRLKTILLKDERVNQEIREELKRFMETNGNEDTTVQNLWDTAKAVLRGK